MLDGIDYYPKRKKRIKLKLFLLLLILTASYGGWFYLDNMDSSSPMQSTSIVISAPESEEETVIIVIESVPEVAVEFEPANSENLDEVIENYEASSYN
ncbi:MAG TPA: hypothetical protein EYG22_02785 [Candidatus Thioglobus sp.]|jgi:hypothetical protein|nr:hypothetical protein [Candidatus Thioglobus sp.]HIL20519.1 hypothetical protein [Candidatus Thioglobus sp.]